MAVPTLALLIASCSSSSGGGNEPVQDSSSVATNGASGQSAAIGSSTAGTKAASGVVGSGGRPASAPARAGAPGSQPNTMTSAGVANTGDVSNPVTGGSAGSQAAAGQTGAAGATAGAGGASDMPEEPDLPCTEKGPEPTEVKFAAPGEGPGLSTMQTGEFKPIMEADPGIPTHTIIRPEPLGKIKHPILAWGEGGCGKSGNIGMFSNLFMEFASHGILVVADGPPGNGPTMAGQDAGPLLYALEWAIKENERPCSKYYHKLAVDKLAVSGQSCGGLMAIQASVDPRITTAFPYNSGLFQRDQSIYDKMHAPMAIFDGGPDDIAYANGMADFDAITKIPILFANPSSCSSNAHVCTFFDEHAGEYGRAGVAWMRWHLLNDQGATGKGMFIGDNCGICDSKWDMMWKMAPM